MDLLGFAIEITKAAAAVACGAFCLRDARRFGAGFLASGTIFVAAGFSILALKNFSESFLHLLGYSSWSNVEDLIDSLGLPAIVLIYAGIRVRTVRLQQFGARNKNIEKLRRLAREVFGGGSDADRDAGN